MQRQAGLDLDLLTYLDNALGQHCPLCFFLECDNSECTHKEDSRHLNRPLSDNSDIRSYNSSIASSRFFTNPRKTIKAKVSVTSSDDTQPSLKRKRSPTGTTLRDLHSQESLFTSARLTASPQPNLLRTQHSDEQLRKVYESQTFEYLESPLSEFDPFKRS